MFGKNTSSAKTSTIDSLIGSGSTIEGDLKFRGGLRIDGHVRGSLFPAEEGVACTVIISENGRVDGSVKASHVVVNGLVNGPVEATEHLDLQPKAKVTGEIRYKILEIHHGAVVEGALSHIDANKPALKLASHNLNVAAEN
jgi:cytoskeletal protein CcmA (bactofilin family)